MAAELPVRPPFIVGLTGGIGSGKSTVGAAFIALGVDLVDADAVAHEVSAPGAAGWMAIREDFGPAYFLADGSLDRARLRREVFAEPAQKSRLERLLHPVIRHEIDRRVASWRGPYGILMVPLLVESPRYRNSCDRLLVVDCPEEEQVRRVMSRSGLTAAEVRAIMATQASRADRLAAADDVIDNSGGPEGIDEQVRRLDQLYRRLAAQLERPAAR